MYILTIASTKGGVGKSTLVLNIATVLLKQGKKVAILDADIQGTLVKCSKIRDHMIESGYKMNPLFVAGVRGEALLEIANDKKRQEYFVLIDSPGADDVNMRNSLLRSDMVITACSPSAVDLWEVESLMNILNKLRNIQNRKIPLTLLFNKVPCVHSNLVLADANTFLNDSNIIPDFVLQSSIKERIVFKHSIKMGQGVIEYLPQDYKAVKEIKDCVSEILEFIK